MFTPCREIVDIIIVKIKISIILFLFQHNPSGEIFEKHLSYIPCCEVNVKECILVLRGGFVNG
jgi:hypothetical protein